MALSKTLLFVFTAALIQLTIAGPYFGNGRTDVEAQSFPGLIPDKKSSDLVKPKNVDLAATNILLRAVLNEAQLLLNPCNLVDAVGSDVRKAPQKSKVKLLSTGTPVLDVSRRMVLDMALPSLREGIRLYRTMFVLQETANLTVFLDQNGDQMYSNTSLRDYSHYYVRAANNDLTQILFVGLIKNSELALRGMEDPAMEFLTANGLIRHPRQYVDFSTVPSQEAQLIMEKRKQMAALLGTQDTFWEQDIDYLTSIMTVSFNGPEEDKEYAELMPKVTKKFRHLVLATPMKLGDQYENICQAQAVQNSMTANQDGVPVEAYAL